MRWRHIEALQSEAGIAWLDVDPTQFRAWWADAKIAVNEAG
jgi:hypothetical protein